MSRPRDPFDDPVLYDWEYRRRRDDVRFYAALAAEQEGPVLDLACGTGRLLIPFVRAGHTVVGLERARPMLDRAAARVARLRAALRPRVLLVRGDLRALCFQRRFGFAVAAFHSVQHLHTDAELGRLFAGAARALRPGGWLAFDTFAPAASFLARDPAARWAPTRFRHPVTGRPTLTWETHRRRGRVLAMTFHYQTLDGRGRPRGPERRVPLAHRLLDPREVEALLARAGFRLVATWGGFDGRPLDGETEQHVYLARAPGRRDVASRPKPRRR
jgi:SAM-dependent methyltransferase